MLHKSYPRVPYTRWLYGHVVTFNIINRDELTRIPGLRRLCKPVLQIYDILVWIRIRIWIRASMTLNNGSGSRFGSGSCYFRHWSSRCQQKTNLEKSFSAHYFLKVHLHHFSKIKKKSKKKSQSGRNQGFSYYFCLVIEGSVSGSIHLTNGSGSRRHKYIRIRRIRIRNTGL